MTRLEALRGLYDAVKAGLPLMDWPRPIELHTDLVWKATQGSVDAALALIEATLPEWDYHLWNLGTDEAGADLIHPDYSRSIHEVSWNQATALLLACLAAMIAIEEGKG
jgi:hypothetical protein